RHEEDVDNSERGLEHQLQHHRHREQEHRLAQRDARVVRAGPADGVADLGPEGSCLARFRRHPKASPSTSGAGLEKCSCRYFSPSSQNSVTTVRNSGCRSRTRRAATRWAPELGPHSRPCRRASRRISAIASPLSTDSVSSTSDALRAKMPGTKDRKSVV